MRTLSTSGRTGRVGLSLESLERRVLLTTLAGAGLDSVASVDFTDADGDVLRAEFVGEPGSQVDILDTTGSDPSGTDIGQIVFTGTDAYSEFRIVDTNPGAGHNDIEILGGPTVDGIATAGTESMGSISLALGNDLEPRGEAIFGEGVGVDIGGSLGSLLFYGTLDFDAGHHFVNTGGDIGLIYADSMVLESASGEALIEAGNGGAADISFLLVDDEVFTSTDGSTLAPRTVSPGSPVTVWDDVGTGSSGRLRFIALNAATSAEVYSIPVVGGGSVVSEVTSSGNLLALSLGAGGDVGIMEAEGAGTHHITIRGAADTDLVNGGAGEGGDLGSLRNLTSGGDIFWVEADNAIGTVHARGNIGMLATGTNNSDPLFPQDNLNVIFENGVQAGGDIGTIRAGGIVNAWISTPGSVSRIDATTGGLVNSYVEIGGDLDVLRGAYAMDSEVSVGGAGRALVFGTQGVHSTDFDYDSGLGRAIFRGDVVESSLNSLVNGGTPDVGGGMIGYVRATTLLDSDLEALGGFGTVIVTEKMADSDINTRSSDGTENVGGGINRLHIGALANSDVDVFGNLNVMTTGTWSDGSDLEVGGNLRAGVVRGDLLDSGLAIDGDVGRLRVLGDLLDDGGEIDVGGNSDTIIVHGSLVVGAGIDIEGNSRRLVVMGGGSESSDIDIDGNSEFLFVRFLADSTDIYIDGDSSRIVVNTIDDGDIDVGGDSGAIVIRDSAVASDIEVGGDASRIFARMLREGTEIDVDGNLGSLVALGANHMDDIYVGGSANRIHIGGMGGGIDGDSSDIVVGDESGGNLGRLFIAPITEFYVEVRSDEGGAMGDVTGAIVVGGSISDLDVEADGQVERLVIRGDCDDGDFEADGGFGAIVVGGRMTGTDIESRAWESETGAPTGGGIRHLRAVSMADVEIDLHKSLSVVALRGSMYDVSINLEARNNTTNDLVGGGGIGRLVARGMHDTAITTYGAINRVALGNGGIDMESSIETLDAASGNLGVLTTRGLIFGDIRTAGNVNSIFSAGRLATVPLGSLSSPLDAGSQVDNLFVDADGMLTGGTLAVDGSIGGIIS